jgi:hypothetical protein
MKLIADDFNQVYVWVSSGNDPVELSPHFDYEEDALQWQQTMIQDKVLDD